MSGGLLRYLDRLSVDREWGLRETFQKAILYGLVSLGVDNYYIFQGGTAIRIFYGSPRLSLDLDFSVLGRPIEKLGGDSKRLIGFLGRLFMEDNIGVSRTREKKLEGGFYRYYVVFDTTRLINKKTRIKIEIAIRNYKGIDFKRKILVLEYPHRTAVSLKIKSPDQILSDKVCSIAGATHRNYLRWRDIFDIYWLKTQHNAKIDPNYLRQEFGSWIETRADLERAVDILGDILTKRKFDVATSELSKILPGSLLYEDLLDEYITVAISTLREALKYV